MKRGDIIVCAAVLLLAAGIFALGLGRAGETGLVAVVTQNGEEVGRIALTGLTKPVSLTVEGEYRNVIVADGSGVRVESADCPHRTCVQTGTLTRAGQSAVCLENKMVLTVEGQGAPDVVIR